MALFRLPRLQQSLPIVDGQGKPLASFLRWWNIDVLGKIEVQENQQNEQIAAITALQEQTTANIAAINEALALAGLALETADGAGAGPTRSGSDTGTITLTGAFAPVAQVDLLTVSAGNLTFAGSVYSPSMTPVVGVTYNYEYQIVEVDNGIDNGVVFPGSFTIFRASPMSDVVTTDTSATSLGSFSGARTTTGSISYRVEARYTSPTPPSTDLFFNLFARRAA